MKTSEAVESVLSVEGSRREAIVPLPDGRAIPAVITEPDVPESGTVNVVFQIQTNDARSFRESLSENRETVTNIVVEAMAQRRHMRDVVKRAAR